MEDPLIRILFIEDDPSDLNFIQTNLSADYYHELEWAQSGEVGLEILLTHKPHVCFIDSEPGSHHGIALLREARASGCRIPIIMIAAESDHQVNIDAMEAGAQWCLFKEHIKPGVLERTIELSISQHQAWSQSHLLNELSRLVNSRLGLNSVLNASLNTLHEYMELRRLAIFTYSESEESLLLACATKGSPKLKEVVPIKDTRFHECFALKNPLYTRDLSAHLSIGTLTANGIYSDVLIPIMRGDMPLGAMAVGRSKTNAFFPDEVKFLSQVGDQMATAMQNVQLYTELQEAYDKLGQSQEKVVQQERLRAMGTMASGIAHDFNNALTPISSYSELLLNRENLWADKDTSRRLLKNICTAASDVSQIINRLSEFYRERAPGDAFSPLYINELVRQCIEITQPRWKDQAMEKGKTIHLQEDLQATHILPGNRAEIREMLMNLIFNAVDAIKDRGTIILHTSSTQSELLLQISDTGEGMDEEVRKRCMEPFFTTREEGTGMGLATTFGTISRHSGRLEIDSLVGRGTTIRISFPVRENLPTEQIVEVSAPVTPMHLLLVEDEKVVRETIQEMLMVDGHTLEVASNGEEGIEAFRGGTFDLILTDRGMPKMNGDKMASIIKGINSEQIIVMLTGSGELMKAREEMPDCVDQILSKPISHSDLRRTLQKMVMKADCPG
jgi:signal transduction histidine kinase/DNA-binding response OmpR family regulator